MNRRIWLPLVLAVAAAIAVTAGVTGSTAAAGSYSSRFATLPGGQVSGSTSAEKPLALSNKKVGYILELSTKPVAVVDANSKAAGHALTMSQQSALVGQIKAAQAPVAAAVKNLGGVVTAKFQTVYNGMGVRISQRNAYKLAGIAGVKAIYAMHYFKPANVNSVPLINGPETWGGVPGYTGTGIKIGDIDTGIDYTHADFGDGDPADWSCALANSTADPSTVNCDSGNMSQWFGPDAPKVKGGIDLVGNCYDAADGTPYDANGIDCGAIDAAGNPENPDAYETTPQPDSNPLDCNSHGTHTAGTLAGFGVDGDGNTYTGPYNADTINYNDWTVGPGMAPNASLYAIRVFGCSGSVDDATLIEAMDWAVTNGMNVINMSLGADFGSASDADSVAASNTAKAGVIVVSASGNAGNNPYMTSSPAAGTNGIAVAANDSNPNFPAGTLNLTGDSGPTLTAIDANGYDISSVEGTYTLEIVPPTNTGSDTDTIGQGCSQAADEAGNGGSPWGGNVILVVERGVCARVAKAIYGQEAGAAAVVMVNTSSSYPPYEGKITNNPDTGDSYTVTIPFLGVQGATTPSSSDNGAALIADAGNSVDLEPTDPIANPTYLDLASFSSFGPSAGTYLKPEITGPGVSVDSAGMGTGNQALIDSGTSMATPHVAGEAALVKQAHPTWNQVQFYKDAILNTADPINVANYSLRGAGAGEADAYNATHTQVVASGYPSGMSSLNFNAPSMKTDYSKSEYIRLRNFGSTAASFDLADDGDYSTGNDHTVTFSQFGSTISSVTVPAHGTASVQVTLSIPFGSALSPLDQVCNWWGTGFPCDNEEGGTFGDIGGLITLTPQSGDDNSGIGLSVPYYSLPTAAAAVKTRINTTQLAKNDSANALVSNKTGGAEGFADWFSLGATSPLAGSDIGSADLLADGVQSFPDGEYLEFALKTSKPWTNPAEDQFEIDVNVSGGSAVTSPDYAILARDFGAWTTGVDNGEDVVIVYNLHTNHWTADFLPQADWNGTTMELPVLWEQLCTGDACLGDSPDGSITYATYSADRNGGQDEITNNDSFNPFTPVFSNGTAYPGGDVVDPGSSILDPVTIDPTAWAANPQEGFLVLQQNNRGTHNADESTTIPFTLGGGGVSHHH